MAAANLCDLSNRPMLPADLRSLQSDRCAHLVRKLVREYRSQGLPVLNGSFTYSNLLEGPAQVLTCNTYRLWEYSSLLRILIDRREPLQFIDVGGAGSAISYLLAESGHTGIVVDMQPILVDVCKYVAAVRGLALTGMVGDITRDFGSLSGKFDLAIFVSVLEHIPVPERIAALRRIFDFLKPKGLLYMTFDYGSYREVDTYRRRGTDPSSVSESIGDIEQVCGIAEEAGFRFIGNDPRSLPKSALSHQSSPGHRNVMWRYSMNVGVVDAETSWKDLVKYLVKRVLRVCRNRPSRYARHNFFRMFLEKP